MPKIALSDVTVRSLKEGMYFDTKTPAFGIRIGKHRRTWIVLKGARSTKLTIGHYPTLSLAQARRKAFIALGTPHAPSTSPPFPEARTEFLDQRAGSLKPSSFYQLTRTLNRHFPWTKRVEDITHHDVLAAIDKISAKSEASHALKDIRTFFNWCVPRYIPHSPCTGLRPPSRYTPRTRLLSDDEVKAIWTAASKMDAYGVFCRLLLTTGQRANQILSLDPLWIRDGCFLFPASVMKSNRETCIPFGPLTASLLAENAQWPSRSQGKKKRELDTLSGVTGYVLHDFRRYFSSTHAKLRTPIDITECLLAHLTGSRSPIQRVYDQHDRFPEMTKAVEAYEAHLQKVISSP